MPVGDEFITATNDHEYRMAQEMRRDNESKREHRTERIIAWAWAFGAVTIVAIIAGLIFTVWSRSSAQNHQERIACTEAGGTWTSIGRGSPVCIRIEEVTP